MVLLRSNLEKSTFFPFLLSVHYKGNCMSIEPDVFKIILLGSLKNLTKFEYSLHLLCKHNEVMCRSNLKKTWTKKLY